MYHWKNGHYSFICIPILFVSAQRMASVLCFEYTNVSNLVFNISVMQYWEISSRTCKHLPPEEQEVYHPDKQTMSVKVQYIHQLFVTKLQNVKEIANIARAR